MPPPPLLGYNNNVRHRGRIFHIQTEDSGIQSPRIKTHLFADGGRIVRSTKTDYSEHVGQPDMAEKVKNLMKEQHKAMFVALRSGQLDATIGFSDDAGEGAVGDGSVSLESSPESLRDGMHVAKAPASSSVVKSAPLSPAAAGAEAQASVPIVPAAAHSSGAPSGGTSSGRASSGSEPAPRPPSDAPDRPYAAPRPAAIFSAPPTTSIFGDVGIDEKSLDDAILSYLAEDPKKPA